MAQIIEARLPDDYCSTIEVFGVIHSKFRSVINIRFDLPDKGFRIITILTPETKGMPDSITVANEYFNKLSALSVGSKVKCNNLRFIFDDVLEVLEGNLNVLRHSKIVFESITNNKDMSSLFKRYIKECKNIGIKSYFTNVDLGLNIERKEEMCSNLQQFAKSWLENDREKLKIYMYKLVGCGIGLTPSCDDALIGIIAVFTGVRIYVNSIVSEEDKNSMPLARLMCLKNLTPFQTLLMNRTTDVSLKYLCCAQEERFSDPILDLVQGIFGDNEDNLKNCIIAVSLVGGSSGMDTLYGMEIACQLLSQF